MSKIRKAASAALSRPRSASSFILDLAGLAAGLATMLSLLHWSKALDARLGPLPCGLDSFSGNSLMVAVLSFTAVVLVIGAGELFWVRSCRKPSTGLAPAPLRPADPGRVAVRLLGLLLTVAVAAFAYWLLPEYAVIDRFGFYQAYWNFVATVAIVALPLAPFYFAWTDRRLLDPHDAYWQLGMLFLARLRRRPFAADGPALRAHFAAWTVKCFFLPLMLHIFNGDVQTLRGELPQLDWNGMTVYRFLFDLSYTIDLLFCVVGYTVTLRLFDSHIRSTEPTVFGWVIALICYQPFFSLVEQFYLHYDQSYWDTLITLPWLRAAWGLMILLLVGTYSLSTVAFGLRFSNLTYRGIITSGPYRYCKHPAYVSKNLSWWAVSLPMFAGHHWYEAVHNCLALGLVNLVYYLRARTEESHLSKDPDYVAYALWMNDHGALSWLGRLLPFLRYKPPAAAAQGSPAPVGASQPSW